MRVLITGANGFVGKNLQLRLSERTDVEVTCFNRVDNGGGLASAVEQADLVFHLAGVNRPQDPAEFLSGNLDVTMALCDVAKRRATTTGRVLPVIYTSSIQATQVHAYGTSKRQAEEALMSAAQVGHVVAHIFRLPNVFGKWARPNYNSAVATFCHNIARSLPIQINDPNALVHLVYIDDLLDCFVNLMDSTDVATQPQGLCEVAPQYTATVGELAREIQSFKDSRDTLVIERVGAGLTRALYSTYVSYLPPEMFVYGVQKHEDARGMFVEMLKTPDSGQFSFFTAHPGITRGGHYHHTKTEKFLVIRGQARFKFRHMQTSETHELFTEGETPQIVETVPGWTHDITNIGETELVVMLWANEIFDRAKPDTFACPV